jgi:hypothetical protein
MVPTLSFWFPVAIAAAVVLARGVRDVRTVTLIVIAPVVFAIGAIAARMRPPSSK